MPRRTSGAWPRAGLTTCDFSRPPPLSFAGTYTLQPAAARCLADDLDALVVHLRYPPRHRRRWRSTNLLERSLGEVKRADQVMGRFPGEQSCLSLVWAVLDLLITHETNAIRFNQLDRQRLTRIRYQDADQATAAEVTAAWEWTTLVGLAGFSRPARSRRRLVRRSSVPRRASDGRPGGACGCGPGRLSP